MINQDQEKRSPGLREAFFVCPASDSPLLKRPETDGQGRRLIRQPLDFYYGL